MKRATELLLSEIAPRRFIPHPWDVHLLKYLNEYHHVTPTEWAHIRSNLMEFIALCRGENWSNPLPDDLLSQLLEIWNAVYLQPNTMLAKSLHIRDWLTKGVADGWLENNPLNFPRRELRPKMVAEPWPEVDFDLIVDHLDPMTPPARYAGLRAHGLSDDEIRLLTWAELLSLPQDVKGRFWHSLSLRQAENMGLRRNMLTVFATQSNLPYPPSFFRTLWRRAVLLAEYAMTPDKRPIIELFYPWHNKRLPRFQYHDVADLRAPVSDRAQESEARLARYDYETEIPEEDTEEQP